MQVGMRCSLVLLVPLQKAVPLSITLKRVSVAVH